MTRSVVFVVLFLAGANLVRADDSSSVIAHLWFLDVSGSVRPLWGQPGSAERQRVASHLFDAPGLIQDGQPARIYVFTTRLSQVTQAGTLVAAAHLKDFILNGLAVTHEDTDLIRVLDEAQSIADADAHHVTMAWVLTDNANDPKGRGPDVDNTRAFYGRMFQEPTSLRRVYFFPMPDARFVLYLLVFSHDASLHGLDLDRFETALSAFGSALRAPRIRAKPVGGEMPLAMEPEPASADGSTPSAEVIGTGRHASLVVHGLKEGQPLRGTFHLRLRSRFDEWRIEKAIVERTTVDRLESDDFPNLSGDVSAQLTPTGIAVDPRSSSTIVYTLDLGTVDDTPAPHAPFWSLAALNPDNKGIVRGRLGFRIVDVALTLHIFRDEELTHAVQSIFHLSDIEYFVPKTMAGNVDRLDFSVPVEFEVAYNVWPRWAALGGIAVALLILVALLFRSSRTVTWIRLSGSSQESFRIGGRQRVPLAPAGKTLAYFTTGWKGNPVCVPVPPATLNGQRGSLPIHTGSSLEFADEKVFRYTVEVLHQPSAQAAGTETAGGVY
jgi:hypothetical protein